MSPRRRLAAVLLVPLLAATGFSPFQAEQRDVREGNEKLTAGDPAAALPRYDAAEREVGARAEIDYDRGNALFRLGRTDEAREAWRRALDRGAGALSTRALQNLGNALARAGDRDGAIRAYADALRADPSNEDARFDLEVLLRKKDPPAAKPPPKPGDAGGGKEGKQQDEAQQQGKQQQRDPGASGARPDPQQAERQDARDGQKQHQDQASRAPRPEPREPQPGSDAKGAPGEKGPTDASAARAQGPVSREDAERLLDALRARERNMPIGPGRDRKDGRRADAEQDW